MKYRSYISNAFAVTFVNKISGFKPSHETVLNFNESRRSRY